MLLRNSSIIPLYFTELIGAKEFPSDPGPLLSITGNRGCYNDTDLPTKPPTASKYHNI